MLERWWVNIALESEILWGEWQGLRDLSTVWPLTAAEKMDKIHFVVLHGLQPTRLLCPWDSPGKDTGISCHSLLQGIYPQPRDWTRVSCITGRFFTVWATREALYNTTFLIKVPFFFLMLSSLYLVQQIYSNCSRSESSWLERLLDHIANGILLLSQSLRVTPRFLRRGLGSWWGLQGTTWKVDKNNSPGLSTLSLSSPHRGEGAWGVSSEVPGPGREDCLEAPDEWDARLHLLRFIPGPAAHPASARADGKQMFAERGECAQKQGTHNSDTLPLLFLPRNKSGRENDTQVTTLQEDLTATGWNQSCVLRICVILKEKNICIIES